MFSLYALEQLIIIYFSIFCTLKFCIFISRKASTYGPACDILVHFDYIDSGDRNIIRLPSLDIFVRYPSNGYIHLHIKDATSEVFCEELPIIVNLSLGSILLLFKCRSWVLPKGNPVTSWNSLRTGYAVSRLLEQVTQHNQIKGHSSQHKSR